MLFTELPDDVVLRTAVPLLREMLDVTLRTFPVLRFTVEPEDGLTEMVPVALFTLCGRVVVWFLMASVALLPDATPVARFVIVERLPPKVDPLRLVVDVVVLLVCGRFVVPCAVEVPLLLPLPKAPLVRLPPNPDVVPLLSPLFTVT